MQLIIKEQFYFLKFVCKKLNIIEYKYKFIFYNIYVLINLIKNYKILIIYVIY